MGYALDLLNKDYEIQKPLSNDLYNPILLGAAGFASIAFSNFIMRKPLMSGKGTNLIDCKHTEKIM